MAGIHWLFILPAAVASFAGGQAGASPMSKGLKGKDIRGIFSMILFLLCIKRSSPYFYKRLPKPPTFYMF